MQAMFNKSGSPHYIRLDLQLGMLQSSVVHTSVLHMSPLHSEITQCQFSTCMMSLEHWMVVLSAVNRYST